MSPLATTLLVLLLITGSGLWLAIARRRADQKNHRQELAKLRLSLDEQLEQAQRERDTLLDALTDAFLLIDTQGRIRFANRAALQIGQARSLVGRSLRESFTDPRLIGALQQCLEAEGHFNTQITLPLPAASSQDPTAMSALVLDSAKLDSFAGIDSPLTRVIIRDSTAEHQTEQIRKDFVANASHELRTPMAIIGGYLENLLDDDLIEDTATSRRFLEVMRKHSDRMSRIIDDMLMISRLESGTHQQLNIETFPLADAFKDVLDRLESLIRNQQAEVRISLPADAPLSIEGDRFYWVQALFNLVENALKQNPRPQLIIELGARKDDQCCDIWVSDNGVGIPSADLPHIFRRFYRVDKHHTQSGIKGTGLGLSIVKRAIEAHGGSITVQSTPGVETRFQIKLPNRRMEPASGCGQTDEQSAAPLG